MLRKMLLTLSGLLILITFSGCSWCTTIEYREIPVEVLIEVPCEVKKVPCHLRGTDAEVVLQLGQCIIDLKYEAKVCQP